MKRGLSCGDLSDVVSELNEAATVHTRGKTRQSKQQRKKAKTGTSTLSQTPSATIGNMDNASQMPSSPAASGSSSEVTRLKLEVEQLRNTVSTLTNQLNFVLSYIGVTSCEPENDHFPPLPSTSSGSSKSFEQTTIHNMASGSRTAATALTANRASSVVSPTTNFKGQLTKDLLSAVYVDLESKKRRSNNIVISGFPQKTNETGQNVRYDVENFLNVEFPEREPGHKIISCRRLGARVEGRCQPLLVSFNTATEATFLLQNAKSLRKSATSYVRENVYINPDLTRAEATAAYEMRQKRRSQRAVSASRRMDVGGRTSIVATGIIPTSVTANSASNLNVNATQFIPGTTPEVDPNITLS